MLMRLSFYGASLIYSACYMYFCKRLIQIDQKVVELSSSQRYSLVENSMEHAVFLLKA